MLWFFIRTRLYIYYKLFTKKLSFLFASFRNDPIIVAVGDSWFNLTMGKWQSMFTVAIIDWLKDHYGYNVFNMAIPGYTFTDEIKYQLFKYPVTKVARKQNKLIVLLSMGGNDVMFVDIKNMVYKKNNEFVINEKEISKFVRKFIYSFCTYLRMIKRFFNHEGGQYIKIVIHGYGYVHLDSKKENKNLSEMFTKYDIPIDIANKSLRVFIDVLNYEYKKIAKKHKYVEYIDLRKLVDDDEFLDDIHPTREGFRKIAARYDKFLSKQLKK